MQDPAERAGGQTGGHVIPGGRDGPGGGLSQGFREDATQAGEQDQTHPVGSGHTGDGFQVALDHRLYDHLIAGQGRVGGLQRGGVAQMGADQTQIALVGDTSDHAFQHHRIAASIGGGQGLGQGLANHRWDGADIVVGQQRQAFGFGQRAGGQGAGRAGLDGGGGIGKGCQHGADAFQQDVHFGEHIHAQGFVGLAFRGRHAAGRHDQQRLAGAFARPGERRTDRVPLPGVHRMHQPDGDRHIGVGHQQRRHLSRASHAAENAHVQRIADPGEHFPGIDGGPGCLGQWGEGDFQCLAPIRDQGRAGAGGGQSAKTPRAAAVFVQQGGGGHQAFQGRDGGNPAGGKQGGVGTGVARHAG